MPLKISSKGCVAEIDAPTEVLERILSSDRLYNFIPLAKEAGEEEKTEVFVHAEVGKFECRVSYPFAEYMNDSLNPNDLAVLAGHLLERARQERGVYCLHSNAVDILGDGVVMFGPPHSGKTVLSLLLARAGKGRVISNECTLVADAGRIEGELKRIRLNPFVSKYIGGEEADGLVGHGNPKLRMFVHPLLSAERVFLPYNDVESIVWDLIGQTDIFIRGINKAVRDGLHGMYVLPSLDTEELAQRRYAFFKSGLPWQKEGLWCYSSIGGFPGMAEDILGRLEGLIGNETGAANGGMQVGEK
jgi:hypothetical protein